MAKVVRGQNDMWTTSPELAKLLVNHEDGYRLSVYSHKWTDYRCPDCNNIFTAYVHNIKTYGFKCPFCSDGISYPEKFVANLLSQLNIKFKRDVSLEWSGKKRYDFYIKDYSMIIETHGKQHYDLHSAFHTSNARNEANNDAYKKELAINNNINIYIELDCSYSEMEYIKQSIFNSKFNDIFDLSNIDWELIDRQCANSKIIEVCDLYNSGIDDIQELANILHIHDTTVRDYLKRCAKLGLCDYTPKSSRKPIICVETQVIYESLNTVKELGFNISQVSECCHGKGMTAGGYHWCYVEDYDSDTYILKTPKVIPYPKKVLCIETGKYYNSLSETKIDGYNPICVGNVCKGINKTHKKQHFKFVI